MDNQQTTLRVDQGASRVDPIREDAVVLDSTSPVIGAELAATLLNDLQQRLSAGDQRTESEFDLLRSLLNPIGADAARTLKVQYELWTSTGSWTAISERAYEFMSRQHTGATFRRTVSATFTSTSSET